MPSFFRTHLLVLRLAASCLACALSLPAEAFECDSAEFSRALGYAYGQSYRLAEIGPECAAIEARAMADGADPLEAAKYAACYAKPARSRMAPAFSPATLGAPYALASSYPFATGFSNGYLSPMLAAPQAAAKAATLIFRAERALLSSPERKDDMAALQTAARSIASALSPDQDGPAFLRPAGGTRSSVCAADFAELSARIAPERQKAMSALHQALEPAPWSSALEAHDANRLQALYALASEWSARGASLESTTIGPANPPATPGAASANEETGRLKALLKTLGF